MHNEQSTDLWSKTERLFHEARELAQEEQSAFVERETADISLRQRVLDLLNEHGSYLPEDPLPDEDLTGSSINGFDIIRLVGRGSMGDVYEAVEHSMDRRVAIKVLRRLGHQGDNDCLERENRLEARFREEIEVLSRLDHPGIVPIHAMGQDDDGRRFFTMRLVTGEDFQTIVNRVHAGDPQWSRERALSVLLRVCETMVFAHHRGVIHRDLKPSHILVGAFGEVYLVDWGLAKALRNAEKIGKGDADMESAPGNLTLHGEVLGTPAYMSPEQAEGRVGTIDSRADIYGLGAVLYHLLNGAAPYSDTGGSQPCSKVVLERLRRGPPRPISKTRSSVPPELTAICNRAMARSPEHRYPTAREFIRDLSAFLENRVVRAHRTGPIVELRKWIGRNRLAALLIVVGVVLGLASSTGTAVVLAARNEDLNAERERRLEWVAALENAQDMLQEASRLAPIPDNLPHFESWLEHSHQLLRQRPRFVRDLEYWSSRRGTEPDPENILGSQLRLERIEADRSLILEAQARGEDRVDAVLDESRRRSLLEVRERMLADFDIHGPALRARIADPARLYLTPDDEHCCDQLRELLITLAALKAKRRLIEERVARTLGLQELSQSEAFRFRWHEAIRGVASNAAYDGLSIEIIPGLLPLGPDPGSGLWEFLHLASGEEPRRDPKTGRLNMARECGIVLVLVPGGSLLMGAQSHDPRSPGFDPLAFAAEYPVHQVHLDPFLISKYEVSQAQWLRLTGENPSTYTPERFKGLMKADLRQPVESLHRGKARRALFPFGLTHPTEAQWEYVARAGTSTPWWTGSDPESLCGHENISDISLRALPLSFGREMQWTQFDDGYPLHAPIGAFAPNPWGLHDVLGNVSEWVLEACADYAWPVDVGTGERMDRQTPGHLSRGGCFLDAGTAARVTRRRGFQSSATRAEIGIRPARSIEPFPNWRGFGKRYR